MSYHDAFLAIETLFSEAVSVADTSLINQNGIYLVFNGAKALDPVQVRVSFLLVVAANSLTGENSLGSMVDEISSKVHTSGFDIEITSIQRAKIESSTLFCVALEVAITINTKE